MSNSKWPKAPAALTEEQKRIGDDFMKHWLETLSTNKLSYRLLENFNQGYAVKNAPKDFISTLEIGMGVGCHIEYEKLTKEQRANYVAIDIRENMVNKFRQTYPDIRAELADCQKTLPFPDGHFDRIIAIHVLEHLHDLPAALKEFHRLCNKKKGVLSVVIPCEGGFAYSLARKISTEKLFAKCYNQKFKWFIESEHINLPDEIIYELLQYFNISHQSYFPLIVPSVNLNLCIGLTLTPNVR